ncbi:MAG: hypothetical protein M9930_23005, partial [Anaerolineae bacterium]|nr:hypothetical protein [Anaerolineae bacterium]
GAPSAIIPVLLGGMRKSRLIARQTLRNGGLINLVEYPAVSRRNSRFRLQVMASHTTSQLDRFLAIIQQAREESELLQDVAPVVPAGRAMSNGRV